LLIINTTSENK